MHVFKRRQKEGVRLAACGTAEPLPAARASLSSCGSRLSSRATESVAFAHVALSQCHAGRGRATHIRRGTRCRLVVHRFRVRAMCRGTHQQESRPCGGSAARSLALTGVCDRVQLCQRSSESSLRAAASDSLSEVRFCNGHVRSRSCDRIVKVTPPVELCGLSGLAHRADGHKRI
jgi:hypothetical protein